MTKVIEYFSEILPKNDSFVSLLIFLLFIFGGLYILFQIIFKLGDSSEKKKKEKKEEKKEPAKIEEKNEEKHSKVVEKKEKHRKIKNLKEDEIVFLKEDEPYVETRPYYSHELKDSYIVGKYDGELNGYGFGENYLHEYFNDENYVRECNKPVNHKIEQVKESDDKIELKTKGDEIVNTYKDLPSELKQYIINKLLKG